MSFAAIKGVDPVLLTVAGLTTLVYHQPLMLLVEEEEASSASPKSIVRGEAVGLTCLSRRNHAGASGS